MSVGLVTAPDLTVVRLVARVHVGVLLPVPTQHVRYPYGLNPNRIGAREGGGGLN